MYTFIHHEGRTYKPTDMLLFSISIDHYSRRWYSRVSMAINCLCDSVCLSAR